MKFTVLIPITGRAGKGKKDLPGSVIDLNPDHPDTVAWLQLKVIAPYSEPTAPTQPPVDPPEKSARQAELEALAYKELQAEARALEITPINQKAPELIVAILAREAELAA